MARGYETITDPRRLAELKIVKAARDASPVCSSRCCVTTAPPGAGSTGPTSAAARQASRSSTRHRGSSATASTSRPASRDMLGDPSVPLWITEGCKKADCGAHYQLCIVALSGVWNWRGTNDIGGKIAARRLARHRTQRPPRHHRVRRRRGTQHQRRQSVARAGRVP